MKLTIKQDKFAQKYVECGNASEAYRYAYDAEAMKMETVNRAAFELLENPKITARVKELQEEYRKKNEITIEWVTNQLKKVIESSELENDRTNHRQASMDVAKLHGLIVDKQHHTGEISVGKKRGAIAERFAKRLMEKEDD